MRINKYLAKSGLGSRRHCDKIIANGMIKVNGKVLTDYSYQVSTFDIVQFKNKYIEISNDNYYYKLHKPKGYICSAIDPQKRKTIYNLLPVDVRLFSIGRLDYNTSGIILLTNDGDLSNFLCHPKNNVIKKYYVSTDNKLNSEQILEVENGIIIENAEKVKAKIIYCNKTFGNFNWDIHLNEGKNREIKRIFNHYEINVKYIHRYEFGGIKLGRLLEGKYKRLKQKEFKSIYDRKKK